MAPARVLKGTGALQCDAFWRGLITGTLIVLIKRSIWLRPRTPAVTLQLWQATTGIANPRVTKCGEFLFAVPFHRMHPPHCRPGSLSLPKNRSPHPTAGNENRRKCMPRWDLTLPRTLPDPLACSLGPLGFPPPRVLPTYRTDRHSYLRRNHVCCSRNMRAIEVGMVWSKYLPAPMLL